MDVTLTITNTTLLNLLHASSYNETSADWSEYINTSARPDDVGVLGVVLHTSWQIIVGVLMACLSLVTVIGNAMVLHAVRTESSLQTVRT